MAGTSGEPGLPPSWDRIPDDASELEPDRLAWLAERRALRRREVIRRLLLARRWERHGLSGPLAIACLAFTTAVAALVVAVVPQSAPKRPAAAPLAEASVASAASSPAPPAAETAGGPVIGRLLPAVQLDGDARAVSTRDLRPAVLALVPAGCSACAATVGAVYRQAQEFRLDLWIVGPLRSRALLRQLVQASTSGGARWAEDAAGLLAATLAARGLTLVTVRADGVIAGLGRGLPLDPTQLPALEPLLTQLATANR
ncbi:MAG TPA: hypothetical protein VI248_20280 [Kineosporiaceae bacterium]